MRLSLTKKIIAAVVTLIVIWGGYKLWFAPTTVQYDTVAATRGTIVQIVSVTGNTAPVKDYSLAFENGGTVATVNYDVGAHVNGGATIVRLNTTDLEAQLAQAQANVDAQTAKLRSLQAGSRPEDIQASQAALAKAKQDLTSMYSSVSDTLNDAYAKANDAVRNQLSSFFTGPETNNPQLTFLVSDSQLTNDAQFKRLQASTELNEWQKELLSVSPSSVPTDLDVALQDAASHLLVVKSLLVSVSQALVNATSLPASTINTYKTAVTAASSETNLAATNVNGDVQGIASQKITIEQQQANLNLKLAGSTQEDIDAQKALVEQAQASAASIQAKLAKASIIAPVAGTVTVQNAKVGEIASPGAPMVTIISDQGLEVDADISEADIGKLSVGDSSSMTLDAFPGKTFSGKVTYIDPGETVIEGVPTYKTTFQFDNLGPEVKPGMTANIDVTAGRHENTIYIPQRAVLTNADGSRHVKVFHNAKDIEDRTVTVGLRDDNGNIEILSGLNEGELVLRSPQ